MNNPNTRLFRAFLAALTLAAVLLAFVDPLLTAATICSIAFGLAAYAAGWHTGYQDGRSSSRHTPRQPAENAARTAVTVGDRAIPMNAAARVTQSQEYGR